MQISRQIVVCSRVSVSGDDWKSGRATSGRREEKERAESSRSRPVTARFFERPHLPRASEKLSTKQQMTRAVLIEHYKLTHAISKY